jgi:pimeloyl-ACP methyl ester carboxylesterase
MHQQLNSPSRTEPAPVIALHCSGAGAGQWRQLGEVLGPRYQLTAPEHYGCDRTGPWTGMHAFTLADEAARTIELIDRSKRKVHLVGHSYGGGVALHAALARPGRVASLTLYEPSAFHVLKTMGDRGAAAFAEISAIARATEAGVLSGDYRRGAIAFVNYWSGIGAWAALRPSVQAALVRWMPKAPPRLPRAHAGTDPDHRICRAAHARVAHARRARTEADASHCRDAPKLLPAARLTVVDGAGHMGPLTHADAVSTLMAAHLGAVESALSSRNARDDQGTALASYGGRRLMAEAVS